ncbi:LacI family DNA-binding transcriptional regulator [Paenibacillus sp. J5C_2022]|uniref:LacI family DNA-binding transcriptional regulator n=1 Tax=Paenibacillus sp. J5C2022 TaxID=2977129 RepID=UPI0021D1B9BD|nr:LacI family DNA-binding transcriptional regulator [Paenibacillus sp. J5C2022]MCU6711219.1 LacI family DNA-binding transcriptional regulator [Paenibacillus sp. J5C2022]
MATIKDIAKMTELSSATVSRVLNNDYSISVTDETRKKIFDAAHKLNYKKIKTPSGNGKKSLQLGLIVWCSEEREDSDPYFLSIRQAVEKECSEQGIAISSTFRRYENQELHIDASHLNALIVIGKVHPDYLDRYPHIRNVVSVDYIFDEQRDAVITDFEEATAKALEHLFQLGHERIGYIGGTTVEYTSKGNKPILDTRQMSHERIMQEKGLFRRDDVYVGAWTMEGGYQLMKQALGKPDRPTAFLIGSDPMAVGAVRAIDECGLKAPDDVSIVSFDDIPIAEFLNPPLTTVKVHTEEMGKMAVKLLLDQVEGREVPLHVHVPTKLMIRQSCGAKK